MSSNPFSLKTSAADILSAAQAIEKSFRVYSREPIEDFWDRLPDFIVDPETGIEVKMSQSKIKEFLKVIDRKTCGKRFYRTRITYEFTEEQSDAAAMGDRFEHLVTGAVGRDGGGSEPILTSRGLPTTGEKRAQRNASKAREIINLYRRRTWEKRQVKLREKCLTGILDILIDADEKDPPIVIDLKYSGLLDNKWEEWGWPKDIRKKESHLIQAKHYILLTERLTGQRPDFFFFVFSNKKHEQKGEEVTVYRPYLIRVSDEALNEHKHMILNLIEQMDRMLKGKKFTARPSYSECSNCPIFTCESRRYEPELVITDLD